jgi:hypothetical protein
MYTFPISDDLRFSKLCSGKGNTETGFSPITSFFPCQDHNISAPTLYFIHLSLHCIIFATDSVVKQNTSSYISLFSLSHSHMRVLTHTERCWWRFGHSGKLTRQKSRRKHELSFLFLFCYIFICFNQTFLLLGFKVTLYTEHGNVKAVPWLRRLFTGVSSPRPWFDSWPLHLVFVVGEYLHVPCQNYSINES